jgi:hypothetical protein
MKNKITMYQAIFYQLYMARKKDKERYIPIWKLIGEVYVKELDKWAFVSYEISARISEMYYENPLLLERKHVIGKSGSRYYAYRLSQRVSVSAIRNEKVLSFYLRLKKSIKQRELRNELSE